MAIDYAVRDAVAFITINRPDKLNAMTPEMREALGDRLADAARDRAVRAVLLSGAGRAFCSGADVGRMQHADLVDVRLRMQQGIDRLIRILDGVEKPVIAAVRGHAAGIGWSLALGCDLVVASTTARFSQIFTKLGLVPDGGAIWYLVRQIGMAKAKEIVYSARFVDAEEALALGLVNQVVADDELMPAAEALARRLADGPTVALGFAKTMFAASVNSTLDQFLNLEILVQPQLIHSADYREGIAAFRDKRPPAFTGK